MNVKGHSDVSFSKEVLQLRDESEHRRVAKNLYPPGVLPLLELDLQRVEKSYVTYWFDEGTNDGQCVLIYDVPDTLSGDILRLDRNLPPLRGHSEIDGDDMRPSRLTS